ncbi:MAG TPA: hypothetical protein ENJ95_20555 [Bacteroidetes bacterium]|nr:hypothetical protein [Bacteroidota bacterium]
MKLKNWLLMAAFCLPGIYLSAQAQQPTVSLKFGKGLNILAADSSMSMKMQFRMQSLFSASRDLEDGNDWASSYKIRRARLKFSGWAFSPKLGYKVEMALSNDDLKTKNDLDQTSQAPKVILDAVLKWKFHQNFSLWLGQTKLPGNRERVVSSQKQQLVDRSLVNSIFNIDRDMGIQIHGKFKSGDMVIKPIAAWAMGEGRNITIGNVGGYSYTGRLELLPFGEFKSKGDYFWADLKREPSPKLALGASINFNKGASRQKQSGKFLTDNEGNFLTNDISTFFVDGVFKYQGFSVIGEYAHKKFMDIVIGKDGDLPAVAIDAKGNSYQTGKGITFQAGYLLKSNWEFAARYTSVTPDHVRDFTGRKEYTFGISKYIVGHSLKVQSDVSLTDKDGTDTNNLRYRLQFEFGF